MVAAFIAGFLALFFLAAAFFGAAFFGAGFLLNGVAFFAGAFLAAGFFAVGMLPPSNRMKKGRAFPICCDNNKCPFRCQ
jgi:hypothetical protein